VPIDESAKRALLRCQGSRSRQFLLPIVRPFARALIVLVQLLRVLTPKYPNSPNLLHAMMVWGMKRFMSRDANYLILRHFNLGSEILAFIADNATPGFRPKTEPLYPKTLDDLRDNVFLKHDLNVYNFVIQLNQELERRGTSIGLQENLDFSAISDTQFDFAPLPNGRLNKIDAQTAIEFYTPMYALFLSDRDFWRASNSLQLDETIGMYAAQLTGQMQHLAMINNRHPMVPFSTLQAGFRLMLHGISTEVLHGYLRRLKMASQAPVKEGPRAG
jgi:hypothetical protein